MDTSESSVVGLICPGCSHDGAVVSFQEIEPLREVGDERPRHLVCGGCGHVFYEDYRGE